MKNLTRLARLTRLAHVGHGSVPTMGPSGVTRCACWLPLSPVGAVLNLGKSSRFQWVRRRMVAFAGGEASSTPVGQYKNSTKFY